MKIKYSDSLFIITDNMHIYNYLKSGLYVLSVSNALYTIISLCVRTQLFEKNEFLCIFSET